MRKRRGADATAATTATAAVAAQAAIVAAAADVGNSMGSETRRGCR